MTVRFALLALLLGVAGPAAAQVACSVHAPGFQLSHPFLDTPDAVYGGSETPEATRLWYETGLSTVNQRWDPDAPGGGAWENRFRYVHTPDGDGLGRTTRYEPADGGWVPSGLIATREYEGDRAVHTVATTDFGPSSSRAVERDSLTFDDAGRLVGESTWAQAPGEPWVEVSRVRYTRDASGAVVERVADVSKTPVVLTDVTRVDVDDAGRSVRCESWFDNRDLSLTPDERIDRTYTPEGRVASVVTRRLDEATGQLVASDSTTIAYDADGFVSEYVEHDPTTPSGTWRAVIRQTVTRTTLPDGGTETEVLEVDNVSGDPTRQYRLTRGPDGLLTVYALRVMAQSGEWTDRSRVLLAYATPRETSTTTAPAASGLALSVAPNPAAGPVRLALTAAEAGEARVDVFDALGRRVATPFAGPVRAGETPVAFATDALAPGLYVVRAQVGPSMAAATLSVAR